MSHRAGDIPEQLDTTHPGRCRQVDCRMPIYWIRVRGLVGGRYPYDPPIDCPDCEGNGNGGTLEAWAQCRRCRGRGKLQQWHKWTCTGRGPLVAEEADSARR